jgi:branched-chain amino acid aminotransferase
MEQQIYLNGKLVLRKEAKISVSDHGFLYGFGLFQTVRAYNGKLFLIDKHLTRLEEAAGIIGIASKLKGIDLKKACYDTLEANHLKEARVRLTVTNGENTDLPWADSSGAPNIIVTAVPYTPFSEQKYAQGFKVGIASVRRMGQSVISSIKSVNYLMNVMARMDAASKGLDETVFLNEEGYIAEGGGGNIFFVREGRLVTPNVKSGIIPGVTREVVLELAEKMGIAVTEGTVGIGVFRKCDEVFMTNALIEIMPITAAHDEGSGQLLAVGGGKAGEITLKLHQAYKEKVTEETAG